MTRVRNLSVLGTLTTWLASVATIPASAQPVRVEGMVVDESGGVVADATVSIDDPATGRVVVSGRTGASGEFNLDVPDRGAYRLVVVASGFERA